MKTAPVSFKNIYHYCQRHYADASLVDLKFKSEERRLGSLPIDWLQNFRTRKYAKVTGKIDKLFSKFAIKCSIERVNADDFKLEKKLSRILGRNDVKVNYIGYGVFKEGYKLKVGNYAYALMTFHQGINPKGDAYIGHGALAEPSRIFNFFKRYSHGRVAKPFMTRFSTENDGNAYMLVKYIDGNDKTHVKSPLPRFQSDFYPLKTVDCNKGNLINGIVVDIGGIEENPNAMKSSKFRQNLFNILGFIDKGTYPCSDVINSQMLAKAEGFICDLIENGENIYNIDLRKITKDLNPLERKYIIKKIRVLKKAHKLKLELQKSGDYEQYKKYFEEYVRGYGSRSMRLELLG